MSSSEFVKDKHDDLDLEIALGNLFLDDNYERQDYKYKNFEQPIYALQDATNYQTLTGQCIWQAADVLSQYIFDILGPENRLKDKVVLELGSGTGLCGLVSANYCKQVVLTDYQDTVMKLINMNINLESEDKKVKIQYGMMDWLKIQEENYFENIVVKDQNDDDFGLLKDTQFQIVIGSDLMWQTTMIPGLINTLNLLFDKNPNLVFYHCYIERSLELHLNLLIAYRDNGFIIEYVGHDITETFQKQTYHHPHLQRVTKKSQFIANEKLKLQGEEISPKTQEILQEKYNLEIQLRSENLDNQIKILSMEIKQRTTLAAQKKEDWGEKNFM